MWVDEDSSQVEDTGSGPTGGPNVLNELCPDCCEVPVGAWYIHSWFPPLQPHVPSPPMLFMPATYAQVEPIDICMLGPITRATCTVDHACPVPVMTTGVESAVFPALENRTALSGGVVFADVMVGLFSHQPADRVAPPVPALGQEESRPDAGSSSGRSQRTGWTGKTWPVIGEGVAVPVGD